MSRIGRIISLSIKEGKWIEVHYNKENKKETRFWVTIKDINLIKKTLLCDFYNDYKNDLLSNGEMYYDNISDASIIENTEY